MHVTLHITTGCNMACSYCYSPPGNRNDMSDQVAFRSIDYIATNFPTNTGIIFFGGEPLLKKDLIRETISYSKSKSNYYHYKVTTNGILLDEDFLRYANSVNLQIALSLDGNKQAHDTHRRFKDGKPTFTVLEEKIGILLQYQPYAKCLMTVSPETVSYYSDSVEYLLKCGFKYIIVSLNYAGNWTEKSLKELKRQYDLISLLYARSIMKEEKFYFSPFEMKLASHIRQNNFECYQCHLAQKQISISHDGKIYPCVQFVKDGISNTEYSIGSVDTGIDNILRDQMYSDSKKQDTNCMECDYNSRCNNKCSCLSWQLTGELNKVTPLLCETERILIPIVDKLGERLYKNGSKMFIQKHYNAVYPILSMIEDMK
jgi:uncharacterized protein